MSVIADLRVDPEAFALGRILDVRRGCTVELDRMVPLDERPVPFVWVYDEAPEGAVERVAGHDAVEDVRVVQREDERTLYALDWDGESDELLSAVGAADGQLLSAIGSSVEWKLELRFPHHRELSTFRERAGDADISLDVLRVYTPSSADECPAHGLSRPQQEALLTAVDRGYYEIPRRISTQELAEELGISDQATTERLRRGIDRLVEETLVDTGRGRAPESPTKR